ncbi:ATPase [Aureococcus anophagefferens]|nr:ATPase [Aureococcus anophagefferens]
MGSDRRRRDRSESRGRRRRSRSRDRSRRKRRENPYPDAKPEESGGKRRKKADDADDEPQPSGLSLTVIMKENPDLSVQEALSKLQIMKQMAGMNMAAGVAQIGSGGAPMLAAIGGQLGAAGPRRAWARATLGARAWAFGGRGVRRLALSGGDGRSHGPRDVANAWLAEDGETAFLELVSVDAAEKAIALDGILWSESALKLGRRVPRTGNPTGLGSFGNAAPGLNPLMMTSNVLMVSNLPKHLDEADVKKILTPFGKLAELNILKDFDGNVKGAAVFRYAVDAASSDAIAGLNNAKLGDLKLVVQRLPPQMVATLLQPTRSGERPRPPPHDPTVPSKVLQLRHMVTDADLIDDEAYADVVVDGLQECGSYGDVENVEIPRPEPGTTRPAPGQGSVFVAFGDALFAQAAREAFEGRAFDGKTIIAGYYPRTSSTTGASTASRSAAARGAGRGARRARGRRCSAPRPVGAAAPAAGPGRAALHALRAGGARDPRRAAGRRAVPPVAPVPAPARRSARRAGTAAARPPNVDMIDDMD